MTDAPRRSYSAAFMIGAAITTVVVLASLLSLVWTPHELGINISARFADFSFAHPLGTDELGRDLLSMTLVGTRNSILIALVAVAIGAGIGIPLGCFAAAKGGLIDDGVMRLNDFVFAFPSLLIAILLTARFGPGGINSMIAIGIFNIPVFARVSRAGAAVIWKLQYVRAAQSLGRGWAGITVDHVLPNIAALILVQMSIQLALGILADAGLSYLGFGMQPPAPSLGKMLREAQTFMVLAPQLALVPGLTIVLSVIGLNLMGDGLRDALDPRIQQATRT